MKEINTFLRVLYSNNWELECFYQGIYSRDNKTVPIVVSPSSVTESQALMTFTNATNDVITITCRDSLSDGEGKFTIPQRTFLIQDQVADFREGTFGTFGQIGSLDLFTVGLILFCMIAFNRVNESVGLIVSSFIIGIAMYFELISFESAIIPMVAFIIMLVIATTKKN